MSSIKVYRVGPLSLGEHSEETRRAWSQYDALKPSGRSGRLTSVYASPSLNGVLRWLKGIHFASGKTAAIDLSVHEITVCRPDEVFLYHVNAYDRAFRSSGVVSNKVASYWETGIRLTDWAAASQKHGLNASEWEILLPLENIHTARRVGASRIVSASDRADEKQELKDILRSR